MTSSTTPGGAVAALRAATREQHARVEAALDLLSPTVDVVDVARAVTVLAAFWRDAEAGLDAWAEAEPADARRLRWPERRRADLLAGCADLLAGAAGTPASAAGAP
uniref:hypothetical protein n=1 Tax=Aquipuribacter sp. SD81 TaxID=3127703 RepID=UPI0030183854